MSICQLFLFRFIIWCARSDAAPGGFLDSDLAGVNVLASLQNGRPVAECDKGDLLFFAVHDKIYIESTLLVYGL